MKTLLTLPDFLNLSIDRATDAYLRELALVAIQSRHLVKTVEQLNAYQRGLTEVDSQKGKLVESRYLVANDGTVSDQKTALMWMQSPLDGTFSFSEAEQAAKTLNANNGFAGCFDWRLPNHDELLSLVVEGSCPSICQEAFPDTPEGWFWTTTPSTEILSNVWTIYFGYGGAYISEKYYFNRVRLVR